MFDLLFKGGRGPVVGASLLLVAISLCAIPQELSLSLALILAIPCLTLVIECAGALRYKTDRDSVDLGSDSDPSYAVIVPAHNEADVIGATLATLPAEATLVVADNCTDCTAELARAAGFETIERQDLGSRGKGFAIEYGLRHLETEPPDIVVIVDADCQVAPGAISRIVRRAHATQRPVQALYLLDRPASSSPKAAVSALAFLVKNWVRPLGLAALGFPCLLQGTGMAFPWKSFAKARLVGDCLVEDMQQGIDLALVASAPIFCPEARVTSPLPSSDAAATSQRTRWEHGHLQTILTQTPRLLQAALVQRRLDLLVLALEVSVPPLTLLGFAWIAVSGLAIAVGAWQGFWLPTLLLGFEGALVGAAIFSAWSNFGRERVSLRSLLSLPLYLLWKVPLYLAFAFKPQKEWVSTPRDGRAEVA